MMPLQIMMPLSCKNGTIAGDLLPNVDFITPLLGGKDPLLVIQSGFYYTTAESYHYLPNLCSNGTTMY